MNERIKELIKQSQVNDLAIDTNGDPYDVKRLDPEKFAELIVQECIMLLYKDDGATHHEHLIKQHFGVEE